MSMGVAALVTWVMTAVTGMLMLRVWVARGGTSSRPETVRTTVALPPPYFPPLLILAHFALAGAGLVVWIVYLAKQADVLAWVASGLLLPVAVLGFSMLGRWVGSRRARLAVADLVTGAAPAESRLPLAAVVVHGLLALTAIVLVLLDTLGVSPV